MEPAQTLYDFTSNLLNDPQARSAFESNPEQALGDAGLGDVSALDVQEVMPLVLDYAPAQGFGAVDSGDQTLGPIDQLQTFTQTFGLSGQETETDVANAAAGVTAVAEDLTGDFTAAGDLTQGLDSSVVGDAANNGDLGGDVTGALTGVTENVGNGDLGEFGDTDFGGTGIEGVDDVTGNLGSTVGDLTGAESGDLNLTGVLEAGSNSLDNSVGDVTDNLSDNVTDSPVTAVVGDVTGNSGDVTGNLSQVHDVVSNVGQTGDIAGAGDVLNNVGDTNVGGIGNDNVLEF
jgi:hypothetical protein